jgi:uncharacterized protein (DUF697 family)
MSASSDQADKPIADKARAFAPVVWLLGKVQSGKTSIIRELTQAGEAEIGNGFRACTKTARVFDFPGEAPIIRFLDTRGLGEVAYDPNEDIGFCEGRSHLILVVVKALDLEQGAVLNVVRSVKGRHPEWPVVVAQTTLHESYGPGARHVLPYPFPEPPTNTLPEPLTRALAYQRSLFQALPGGSSMNFVPIDFTQPHDGLEPVGYGREALIDALITSAPAAVASVLNELPGAAGASITQRANAHILGFALAAGASDVFPLAGAVAVPMVQAAMLQQLAKLSGATWDRRAYAEFGTGTLVRVASGFGARQLAKLIPVYGQTAGAAAAAAASFASTYAIGKAANYYLTSRRRGKGGDQIASVYQQALREAFGIAKERDVGNAAAGGKA